PVLARQIPRALDPDPRAARRRFGHRGGARLSRGPPVPGARAEAAARAAAGEDRGRVRRIRGFRGRGTMTKDPRLGPYPPLRRCDASDAYRLVMHTLLYADWQIDEPDPLGYDDGDMGVLFIHRDRRGDVDFTVEFLDYFGDAAVTLADGSAGRVTVIRDD